MLSNMRFMRPMSMHKSSNRLRRWMRVTSIISTAPTLLSI